MSMLNSLVRGRKGYTLIEVLVVIACVFALLGVCSLIGIGIWYVTK